LFAEHVVQRPHLLYLLFCCTCCRFGYVIDRVVLVRWAGLQCGPADSMKRTGSRQWAFNMIHRLFFIDQETKNSKPRAKRRRKTLKSVAADTPFSHKIREAIYHLMRYS
jgi:hypothetical protein